MDTKNYGLSIKEHLKSADTLLPDPCEMGVPLPYVQLQIRQNFIAQSCVQVRVEDEKSLNPLTSSYCDAWSRPPTSCRGFYAKDLSPGTGISTEEYSDFKEKIASKDLPEELTSQFSDRHCDLCIVQMNSALQSRMHYHGKQHQKKVRFFMNNWMKEHGGSYSKKIRKDDAIDCLKSPDDKRLYCECCDLSFTSHLHAQQHYRGRNHQRVLNGLQPLKSGYFNKLTCKWQRFPPLEEDTGVAVSPYEPIISCVPLRSEPMIQSSGMHSAIREEQDSRRGRFFCELCNIGATSQEQLDMHIKGGKHKKAERVLQQFDLLMDDGDAVKVPPTDSILASVTKECSNSKKAKADYSIYRTPSGKFYCQLCNLTIQCESQFIQHLDSKKHRITTGPKKPSIPGSNH